MSGSLGGFGNQTRSEAARTIIIAAGATARLSELDRDYEDYCREREQQFHSDFDSWRRSRSSQSPSATTNASGSDLGAAANAGVGTTTVVDDRHSWSAVQQARQAQLGHRRQLAIDGRCDRPDRYG